MIGSALGIEITFNYVTWFCVIYLMASYIRAYPEKIWDNIRLWVVFTVVAVVVSAASVLVCTWLPAKLGMSPESYAFISDSNKILAVCVSVCGFLFFKNIKSSFINAVSSTTFGVLCIHAGSDSMRQWLWKDVLDNVGMYGSRFMIAHALISIGMVFAICAILDYGRIRFIETPIFRKWGTGGIENT